MMRIAFLWRVALIVLAALYLVNPPAWAGDPPQNEITMNFQNVDIPVLAKFISEITGRNFIVDESVRGKVSIISPTKVTPEQAYQIFQSVLQVKGFTTVQVGKIIKIVPSRVVKNAAEITESQQPLEARGDEYVTRMIKLKNVEAGSILSVIQPMVSHDGMIAAFPEDNVLILTDDAYNVQRLLKIIGSLDVEGVHRGVEVIILKYAFAEDLAPEVEQIINATSGIAAGRAGVQGAPQPGATVAASTGTNAFKVIPDTRTNSLVVVAGPIQLKDIREVITKLDVRPPDATSRLHVYRLRNATAAEMVSVLGALIGGGGGPTGLSPVTGRGSLGRGSQLGTFGNAFGGMGGMGSYGAGGYGGSGYGGSSYGGSSFGSSGFGGGGFGGGFGGMSGGGLGGSTGSSSGVTSVGSGSSGGGKPGGRGSLFSNAVNVTADPATNSLVISASPQDYETLKTIITELDVPRVQILVEAIIVEISVERTRSLGIDLTSSTGISNSILGFGQVNTSQFQNALGNPLGIQGLALALTSSALCTVPTAAANVTTGTSGTTVSGTTTGTTANVPCSIALLQALETDTHANVLSAPTLLTADNEEATIVVGQNVPFVGSASANSGLPGQIFNSVQRQNVGITLDIVPQSSEGGYVRLDMYEEVSNVLGNTANNPLGPTTTIRDASTTVFVQNHRTAVVGGLISGNENYNATGIPWISDIPVLGNLLSTKGTDRTKDNLLVFITPHIVHDKADLRALALDQRQQFINSIGPAELHRMPASQVRELYKPSFSIPVPPAADLTGPAAAAAGTPPGASPAPPESSTRPSGATPFNTEEIGPSSSINLPPGTPMVATETGAPASFEAPPGTPSHLIPLRAATPDTGASLPSAAPISSSVVPVAPSASGAVAAARSTD